MIIQTAGGLGLFLLGMITMTEGLRQLAGDAMRRALMRFTNTPLSGAVTGATGTAILQSSSATTVATVGFVGAGLMGFPEALGVIFGANIGTTLKGWLFAVLGFKYKLDDLFLPLIFLGALMRLFASGRLAHTGSAIAGFSLIFIGISALQQGMAGVQNVITPESFPDDTIFGRLQLVLLGILATIVTQSSSAGVAAALTALYAGAINFPQAAALVIGMDVGTTITAAIATIGGSVGARRTGFSHVIYNCFTGIGALLLITPYISLWDIVAAGQLQQNAEIALVAFHTSFNTLGVIIVLPFTQRFARFMERLIPEKFPLYTEKLDKALLAQPELALLSVQSVIQEQLLALIKHTLAILRGESWKHTQMSELQQAVDRAAVYLDRIHLDQSGDVRWKQLIALLHTLDHMQRLHERCAEEEDRAITARESEIFTEQTKLLISTIKGVLENIELGNWPEAHKLAEQTYEQMFAGESQLRAMIIEQMGRDEVDVPAGTHYLEAVRWLTRVSRHIAQINKHFAEAILSVAR